MTVEQAFYDIPIPADLTTVRGIHDGRRWLSGVRRGSVAINDGVITFVVNWHGNDRRFTMAVDLIGGYECDE